MAITADATLVNAAFKMGHSRVPHDTSKIFQDQFKALGEMYTSNMRNFSKMVETGAKQLQGIKTEKAFYETARKLKEANKETLHNLDRGVIDGKYDIVTKNLEADGDAINQNYANGKGGDGATTRYVRNEILDIKDQIKQLESFPGESTPRRKAEIQQLYKAVDTWRNENNESLALRRTYGDHLANGTIDFKQSFQEKSIMTGETYNDPNMAMLTTQVLHMGINLDDVGIEMGRNEEGERGYYYDPDIDRTLQHNNYLKGIKQEPTMGPKRRAFISEKELFSKLKLKDTGLVANIGKKIGEEIKSSMLFEDTFEIDANGVQTGKGKKLKVTDYNELSERNEKGYYDLITAPFAMDAKGGKGQKRDVKSGIIYMSNNKIDIGGVELFNYNEISRENPNITGLTYQKLGLSGAVESNGIPGLQADELLDGDIDVIHKKLMNPETPEEVEIAARELARALNLVTREAFNKERGENTSTGQEKNKDKVVKKSNKKNNKNDAPPVDFTKQDQIDKIKSNPQMYDVSETTLSQLETLSLERLNTIIGRAGGEVDQDKL